MTKKELITYLQAYADDMEIYLQVTKHTRTKSVCSIIPCWDIKADEKKIFLTAEI